MYTTEQKLEIDRKLKKFIQDPDWSYIEDLILSYLAELVHVNTLPIGLTNDQIATEVRGRQLLFKQFSSFLNETGLVKEQKTSQIIKPINWSGKK